jgi:hypothetical protein
MDTTEITSTDVATMASVLADDAHPLVGLPDGHVDPSGEKIAYEFDTDGSFIGWHKEPSE